MTTYTVRIESREDGRYKVRDIDCAGCGETFTVERRMPAKGRWPSRHPECAKTHHLQQNKTMKQKTRSGEHTPGYAASAPLWDRSDHEGPGARTAMSNATAMAMTDSLSTDDTWIERDAVDQLQDVYRGTTTGRIPAEPRKAPAYTGDDDTDKLKRALANQKADQTFSTSGGASVGLSSPEIRTGTLDDDAKAWLQKHPDWWREETTEDGGWGCRRGEYAENRVDLEEVYWLAGIHDDPEDDEFIKEMNRELREEIDQYMKRMAA